MSSLKKALCTKRGLMTSLPVRRNIIRFSVRLWRRWAQLPAIYLVRVTNLIWALREFGEQLKLYKPRETQASFGMVIEKGYWWQHDPLNPTTSFYFTPPEGKKLYDSLVDSRGSQAFISSYAITKGWMLNTWSGLITLCSDRTAAQETSSGCGDRMAVGWRIHQFRESFIALQRNQNNYAHFLVEIATSLLAFESHIASFDSLVIGSGFGQAILRLAGFRQKICIAPPQSLCRISNVEVMRMLPSGFLQTGLLHELAHRVRESLKPYDLGAEVVLLLRSPKDRRQLVNWHEAADLLSSIYPEMDIVIPGELPLSEQIRRLSRARIVVATQGAHAINILWCEQLEHYIELTANGDGYVAAVARALGANVQVCFGRPNHLPEHPMSYSELQFANYVVDTKDLESTIQSLR